MKITDDEIQRLKNKEMKIRELRIDHFVDSNKLEVENILKLLSENILDFKSICTLLKNGNDYRRLLESVELFEELIKNNNLNTDNLRYLLNSIDKWYELNNLPQNTSLLKYITNKGLFKELVDKYKNTKDLNNNPCLYVLLENKEFFQELFENNSLSTENLRYLLNRIDKFYELDQLSKNTSLLKYIVNNDVFKELVNTFKSMKDDTSCLWRLLENKELFDELTQNNKLTKDDLRHLLNRIDNSDELDKLCDNTSLIKYVLKEFVFNKEIVDKFNTIIENEDCSKYHYIHTIFDLIAYYNKNNEEILKLNELNRKVYLLNSFELSLDQKLELTEILKDNEQAQNTLIQIVETNLEDQYKDFETLKNLLTKDNEKKKIKMNF